MSNETYIVAYGYTDKFEIPAKVAEALMVAKDKGMGGVKHQDQYYSANFMWIQPKRLTALKQLDSKQLRLAGELADWLARAVHDLGWSDAQAVDYSLKLLRRCAYSDVKAIYRDFAMGAYPSAKKFLMEAKQLDSELASEFPLLTSGE